MGASPFAESIAAVGELLLEYWRQHLGDGLLYHTVYDRGDSQLALSSVRFGDFDSLYCLGPVASIIEALDKFGIVLLQVSIHRLDCHSVYA